MFTTVRRMGTPSPRSDATETTSILVFSDTHAFPFKDPVSAFGTPFPKVDVVLHCGDLTQAGGIGEYKRTLKMLGACDAELKLVIAGNHDVSLDREWCEGPEDEDDCEEAIELMIGPAARDAGVTYLTEGTHKFTLSNGVTFSIYASPYTPKFGEFAFMYLPHEDRFNNAQQVDNGITSIATNPIPDGVDIVMTHGPAFGFHNECKMDGKIENVGCKMLLRALKRTMPLMHCFGHIHEGAGTSTHEWEVGMETILVNAAIMGGKNDPTDKPTNMPIIVELDLPRMS